MPLTKTREVFHYTKTRCYKQINHISSHWRLKVECRSLFLTCKTSSKRHNTASRKGLNYFSSLLTNSEKLKIITVIIKTLLFFWKKYCLFPLFLKSGRVHTISLQGFSTAVHYHKIFSCNWGVHHIFKCFWIQET